MAKVYTIIGGVNGAGKSTTVKVMSGILTPEEGNCSILGRTPWKERTAHVANIGVVFGQRSQLSSAKRFHDPYRNSVLLQKSDLPSGLLKVPVQIVDLQLAELHVLPVGLQEPPKHRQLPVAGEP